MIPVWDATGCQNCFCWQYVTIGFRCGLRGVKPEIPLLYRPLSRSSTIEDGISRSRKEFVKTLTRSLVRIGYKSKPTRTRATHRPFTILLALCLMLGGGSRFTPATASVAESLGETLPVVISAGADHDIKKWDANGKLESTLGSHGDSVNALLLVGSDTLISVGEDGACKIWSLTDGRLVLNIDAVKGGILSVALSPNKKTLAMGTAGGKIGLWDKATGRKDSETDAHNDGVRALHFASDGTMLISVSSDRQMRFWKVTAGSKPALDYHSNISAHDEAVNGLSLSPDDRTIATISSDGYLKTWMRSGGALINRMKVCDRGAAAVAYSPDGRTIATGDEEGRVRLWNAGSCAPISTLGSHDRAVTCLAWSSDGKFLASGGADKTLRYWSLDKGKQAARITAHDGTVKAVVVLP